MRVDAKFSPVPLASTVSRRGAAGQRFSLGGSADAAKASSASSSAPLATLDALLAVQGEGDPAERRRRSVKRGHDLLDALDQLKAAILSGRVGGAQLQHVAAQLSAQRSASGDPKLDDLIAHIELRARVELAKLGRA
jgi:hypothetical protein